MTPICSHCSVTALKYVANAFATNKSRAAARQAYLADAISSPRWTRRINNNRKDPCRSTNSTAEPSSSAGAEEPSCLLPSHQPLCSTIRVLRSTSSSKLQTRGYISRTKTVLAPDAQKECLDVIKTFLPPARTRGTKSYMIFAYFIRRNDNNYTASIVPGNLKFPFLFNGHFFIVSCSSLKSFTIHTYYTGTFSARTWQSVHNKE